jgi:ankyrin repeat protein
VHDDGSDHSVLACATSAAMVADLIIAGADPHQSGPFHSSIVTEIARNRHVTVNERTAMLRALAAAGVDLDEGDYPAIAAQAMDGDDQGVEALLAAGAEPRVRNALASACFSYSDERDAGIERVIDLLIAAGFDPNERDTDGFTPLHQALSPDEWGAGRAGYRESDDINVAAAAALIRHGASIDIVYPNFDGYGPLHVAALQCSAAGIELLLSAGADPAQRAPGGETPLDVARSQLASDKRHRRRQAPECIRLLTTR